MNKEKIEAIKRFAIDISWKKAFNGKAKGNRHLFRVVRIAKFLAKNVNEEVDIFVVESGAWLHDIGLIKGNKNHWKTGAKMAKKFLKELGLEKEIIKKICHCIEAHEGKIKAKTIEAKIVHDADALDKMGALGIIRHCWKLSQLGLTTEKIAKILVKHIKERENKLYLPISRKIAKKLNKLLDMFDRTLKDQLELRVYKNRKR